MLAIISCHFCLLLLLLYKKMNVKRAGNITMIEDFDFGNILVDKKSYKDILIFDISCKMF